jgi:hypothetical protein
MPCLVGCLALFMPRLAIILVAIFSNYLSEAYDSWIWPVLGFFFLPLTTLAYAFAWHLGGGSVNGVGLILVVLAVLVDLGLLGTGERSRRQYRREFRG